MTDFDYPPTREWTLGDALADVEARADAGDEDEDGGDRQADTYRKGLQWAVRQFGADATVTLRAFTATTRDRAIDTANRKTVGPLGNQELRTWFVAAALEDAPWLNGDEDLTEAKQVTGALPPALADWLDAELESLNDLTEGN